MTQSGSPAGAPIRLHVVLGRRLLAEAVRGTFEACPDLHLEAVTADGVEAARQLCSQHADLVLVDASIDVESALATVRYLRDNVPRSKIVSLGVDEDGDVLRFIEAGATGYVPATASFDDMVATLRDVHRGRADCAPEVAVRVLERIVDLSRSADDDHPPPPDHPLTPREQEVLELLADGLANKEIAARLDIALSTVKNHVHNLLEKLGVGRRREAVKVAFELGLIERCLPRRNAV